MLGRRGGGQVANFGSTDQWISSTLAAISHRRQGVASRLGAATRDLPADWRPLAAGVWGLDLTATGRPEGRELAAAAGDVEPLLDRPGERGADGGSERAAVEDSGGSESSTPK
jgi:hypothetical protein